MSDSSESSFKLLYYYRAHGNLESIGTISVSPNTNVLSCKQAMRNTPPDLADLYMIPQAKPVPMNDVESTLGRLSLSVLEPLRSDASLKSILGLQPEEDHLHFVLVDRRNALTVRFWIPSTGHAFNVKVGENDNEVSLLPVVQKGIPTSMNKANLAFYKSSYSRLEQLFDMTGGQLLPNLDELFTEFDDTPFSELPCVTVRQRERKHHLSWDPIERATKRRKLDEAPSSMGVQEYLSLQINPSERLFDYRGCARGSQELPEKDLPPVEVLFDGFGKFMEIWRALPGFEAKPVSIELRKEVDVFADTMSRVCLNEGARCLEGLEKLNAIFQTAALRGSITSGEIPSTATTSNTPRADGLSSYDGIPSIIVKFKNEDVGSPEMPMVELASYYSRIVKYLAWTRAAVVGGSRLPTLGITVVGPTITFFGLAHVGSVVCVPLTSGLWCLPVECGGSDRHQLCVAFNAASVLVASIEQEAKRLTDSPSPASLQRPFYPQLSKLARYPDPGSSIDLQVTGIIEKSLDRHVYAASSASSGDLVLKLTYSYSCDLHAFCADLGHAPRLVAFERLPGGIFAVAMERPKGDTLDSMASISTQLRDKWSRDVQAIVNKMHKAGYVHGDLRPPNMLCVGDRVMLLDFDWGGKVGVACYPHARLHPQLTKGRDMSNLEITKDDDHRVLWDTLTCLHETVRASGSSSSHSHQHGPLTP